MVNVFWTTGGIFLESQLDFKQCFVVSLQTRPTVLMWIFHSFHNHVQKISIDFICFWHLTIYKRLDAVVYKIVAVAM